MKLRRVPVVAPLLVTALLAACSGSETSLPTPESTTAEPTATESTTRPEPSTSIGTTTAPPSVAPTSDSAQPEQAVGASPEASERLLTHPIEVVDDPCPDGLAVELRCGRATVPLDWTTPDGEQIEIWYGVLPAIEQPATATFIPFEGGPSGALSTTFGDYVGFATGLASSDTLIVDVRGVGRSSRISCSALETLDQGLVLLPETAVADCAMELGTRRDYFTTVSTVLDIEAIRRQLGLEKPSLAGFSYGTFVATTYGVLFPDQVEAVFLDGAFPLATNPWADDVPLAIGTSAALQCERSGECDPVEFVNQLSAVAIELRTAPREAEGRPSPLDEGALIGLAQGALQTSFSEFREAISTAANGDFTQLEALDLAARTAQVPDPADSTPTTTEPTVNVGDSLGLGIAVICNDYLFPYDIADQPADRRSAFDAALAALPEDAFAPFSKAGWVDATWDHPNECLLWPVPATPSVLKPPYEGPFSEIPVLLLNGDLDLQTPLDGARAAQQQWPNSVLIEPANGTHVISVQSTCHLDLAVEFLKSRTLPAPDACASEPLPIPAL
jgi:pimeloyl-ACP methyl ester carboxylesterase